MAYNKVTYKNEILMDITDSTVTPETLSEGVIAYGSNGERIVGTAISGGSVSVPLIVNSLAYDGELGNKTGYKSITIGSSVSMIDINAFGGCSNLEDVTFPETLEIIGDGAFSGCTSLTSITIPNSVTSIGEYAFSYCSSLTSATIGNGVTSIGDWAFYECRSLTSVTISNSVTSIGEHAFDCCTSLKSINYNGTKAQWEAIEKGYGWDNAVGSVSSGSGTYIVYCTDGTIESDDTGIAPD